MTESPKKEGLSKICYQVQQPMAKLHLISKLDQAQRAKLIKDCLSSEFLSALELLASALEKSNIGEDLSTETLGYLKQVFACTNRCLASLAKSPDISDDELYWLWHSTGQYTEIYKGALDNLKQRRKTTSCTMQPEKCDNVDLLFVLSSSGSTLFIYVNSCVYEFDMTFIFGDPVEDLLNAAVSLLKGSRTHEFLCRNEQASAKFVFSVVENRQHMVRCRIWEPDRYSSSSAEQLTVEFLIEKVRFAKLVYYQILKFRDLMREPDYQRDLGLEYDFETGRFPELRELLQKADRSRRTLMQY